MNPNPELKSELKSKADSSLTVEDLTGNLADLSMASAIVANPTTTNVASPLPTIATTEVVAPAPIVLSPPSSPAAAAAAASSSSKLSSERKSRNLYEISDKDAHRVEKTLQQYVNGRFFKIERKPKNGAPSEQIISELSKKAINGDGVKDLPIVMQKAKTIKPDLNNTVELDGYSARSVIIALSKFLNTNKYLPTVIYKIGETHIFCQRMDNDGLVFLQPIKPQGGLEYTPSSYGDDKDKSISKRLIKIITSNINISIHELMRAHVKKIKSMEHQQAISSHSVFLDNTNFLCSIMEIVRYSLQASPLYDLPIATAQARTSQLLIDKTITVDDAYGASQEFYATYPPVKSYDFANKRDITIPAYMVHQASFGVVTGKKLTENRQEVESKIQRVNTTHNLRHQQPSSATNHLLIPGCRALRMELGAAYGSDGESSDGDYSDKEAPDIIKEVKKITM